MNKTGILKLPNTPVNHYNVNVIKSTAFSGFMSGPLAMVYAQ